MEDQTKKSTEAQETSTESLISKELSACKAELQGWKDKAITLAADFENYKKRLVKERQQLHENAAVQSATKLLPIVDDFERALGQNIPENSEQLAAWKNGFSMIHSALAKMLEELGVTEIAELEVFDPELHEAVMSVVSEQHESGAIVALVQKGYRCGKRIIRPAKVTVAQ